MMSLELEENLLFHPHFYANEILDKLNICLHFLKNEQIVNVVKKIHFKKVVSWKTYKHTVFCLFPD